MAKPKPRAARDEAADDLIDDSVDELATAASSETDDADGVDDLADEPEPEPEPVAAPSAARDRRPLFLDATVHLPMPPDEKGHIAAVPVKGGRLVDELEVELTDEQIDELTAKRAIRFATEDEIAAATRRSAKQ